VNPTPTRADVSFRHRHANDMSAKPGSATGKSATPFATMDVSPFLWCVDIIDRSIDGTAR